jgi:hypothetical protein
MDNLVTLLFLVLWIVVAFFGLRYLGRRYFHEPRRADVAALGVALAFAFGTLWPYSARVGGGASSPAAQGTAAPTSAASQVVAAEVLGSRAPVGGRDVSASCRSAKRQFARTAEDGSVDDMRSDEQQSTVVTNGARIDGNVQYLIHGWAAEPAAGRPAQGVCLVVDGKINSSGRSYYGLPRPDVGSGYHHDELVPSGYVIAIPAGSLPRGHHRVGVLVRLADGSLVLLSTVRDITVA